MKELERSLQHQRIHHKFEIAAIHAKYRRVLNDIHREAEVSLVALAKGKPHVVEAKLNYMTGMTEQLIREEK